MATAATDTNGFIEIQGNRLSKPGVFDYLGSEINAPEPDRIYQVFRPPEELADPECVASFKLQPWVIEHKMLGKNHGVPAELKGVHGVIGENVYYDEDDKWLKGNIKIFSDSLEEAIASGKDELSLGFACTYHFDESGSYEGKRYNVTQRNIRGNHLASVDESRMDVAVMDSAMDQLTVTLDTGVLTVAEKTDKTDKTPDSIPGTGQDMDMTEMVGMMKELMPMMKEVRGAMDMMKEMSGSGMEQDPDKMAMDADKDDDDDKGMDEDKDKDDKESGMDAKSVTALLKPLVDSVKTLTDEVKSVKEVQAGMDASLLDTISKRDALAAKLSRYVGTFDHASKTLAEVAKYGIEKLGVPCQDGGELVALTAYLHDRPQKPELFTTPTGQDGKTVTSPVDDYLNGGDE